MAETHYTGASDASSMSRTQFEPRRMQQKNARCFKRLAQSWCAWHGSCFFILD